MFQSFQLVHPIPSPLQLELPTNLQQNKFMGPLIRNKLSASQSDHAKYQHSKGWHGIFHDTTCLTVQRRRG